MAKRFTDSDKWKNPWFRTMPNAYRWLWIYILDNCDQAGIWMGDFHLASYFIGSEVTEETAADIFGDKIIKIDSDKWFVPSFITFQYGSLKSDSRPHMSVIKILEKYKIDLQKLTLSKGYPKGINTLKDKDKDKDKEQDQDKAKDKDQDKDQDKDRRVQIEIIYKTHYPLKKGKSDGIDAAAKDLKTEQDLIDFETAVVRYADDCKAKGTEDRFIKHFSTFVSTWRDWLDADAGKSTVTPIRKSNADKNFDIIADQARRVMAGEL